MVLRSTIDSLGFFGHTGDFIRPMTRRKSPTVSGKAAVALGNELEQVVAGQHDEDSGKEGQSGIIPERKIAFKDKGVDVASEAVQSGLDNNGKSSLDEREDGRNKKLLSLHERRLDKSKEQDGGHNADPNGHHLLVLDGLNRHVFIFLDEFEENTGLESLPFVARKLIGIVVVLD
jgi:hypothetical protein